MHTEQALAISGMLSILTPAGGLRTEGMGDGWMIRGTDAEKARIPALMGMPALPAPGSLAPRSFCPHCYMPLLWIPATDGIPLLRSTLAPPSQPIWIHILLYWLPTMPAGCTFSLPGFEGSDVPGLYISSPCCAPSPQTGAGKLCHGCSCKLPDPSPSMERTEKLSGSWVQPDSATGSGATPASWSPA